jgi:hypothetical protein
MWGPVAAHPVSCLKLLEKKTTYKRLMTWQQHLKKCAAEWQQMKLARKNAEKAKKRKSSPPKVPRRLKGKRLDPSRDIN